MPLLFSYGTLRDPQVQLDTFGRLLTGEMDELVGFEPSRVKIEDPDLVVAIEDREVTAVGAEMMNERDRIGLGRQLQKRFESVGVVQHGRARIVHQPEGLAIGHEDDLRVAVESDRETALWFPAIGIQECDRCVGRHGEFITSRTVVVCGSRS